MPASDGYSMRMTLRRLLIALPALALVVLVVAGCGGSGPSKEEYEQGLATVQEHLRDATTASRESSEATDPAVKRAKLGEAHEALDEAATAAERLEPPKEVVDEHERLADALRDYADVFLRLAELDANDPDETRVYSDAGEVAERLDKASRDLERAGYSVAEDDS